MPNVTFRQIFSLLLLLWPLLSMSQLKLHSPFFSVHVTDNGQLTKESHRALPITTAINKISQGHYYVTVTIDNISSAEINLSPLILNIGSKMTAFEDPSGGYSSAIYSYLEPFVINQGEAKTPISGNETSNWFGYYNRYNIEAVRPNDTWTIINNGLLTQNKVIEAGESIQYSLDFVQSSREKKLLAELGLDGTLLQNSWGWFRWLCLGIWGLLELLFHVTDNWGIAIILLALAIRLLTIPITTVSLEYQKKAKEQQIRLDPKLAKIKRDYTGIELSEKIIALYEAEQYDHTAPFKGILGLLIQIPILIALFTLIGEISELRYTHFLWINDLSLSDRTLPLGINIPFFGAHLNVLPFLMAGVTIASTWFASQYSDTPTFSLFGMAILFFIFFYSFPAALVLYWFASNLFQLIHQLVHRNRCAKESV